MRLYSVNHDLGSSRMQSSLDAGAKSHVLSRELVSAFAGGKYLLFAEEGLDLPLRDLRFAGSYSGTALSAGDGTKRFSDARAEFARFLAMHVQIQPYSIVIENPLALPSHPYVASFESPLLTLDDEVYHYILDGRSTEQTYQALVESCRASFLTGICTRATWFKGQPVELFLADAIKQAVLVFTTALDDEGFLFWIPDTFSSKLLGEPEIHGTKP